MDYEQEPDDNYSRHDPLTAKFEGLAAAGSDLEFEFPPGGGVVIVQGPNGCGKSEILHHAQVVLSGDGKLNKRDKAKTGSAEIAGRKLVVKKLTRTTGDLEVEGVGDLDIGVLHSPGKIDPVASDSIRIKALVRLSKVAAEIDQFYRLAGGEKAFDELVDASAREKTDLVEMAGLVKRGFESEARRHAKTAKTETQSAVALRKSIENIDLTAPHGYQLRLDWEAAHEAKTRIVTQREQSDSAAPLIESARRKLAEFAVKVNSEADAKAEAAALKLDEADEQVERCEAALTSAKTKRALAEAAADDANQAMRQAADAKKGCEDLNADISELESRPRPTDDLISQVESNATDARAVYDAGILIDAAMVTAAQAAEHESKAAAMTRDELQWRQAALACSEILADAVREIPNCLLTVTTTIDGDDRLTIATPRSDETMFNDLSDGERWGPIIPLAAGADRVIVLPQSAWEGLDPDNRQVVYELCRENHCWIVTAQAAAGQMRAVCYDPNADMIECGPCSEAGGADMPVYHLPPECKTIEV